MSNALILVTTISLFSLLAIMVFMYRQDRNKPLLVIHLSVLAVISAALFHLFVKSGHIVGKGAGNDIYFVIILYFFMLSGMFGNFLYARFTRPGRRRPKFDFGTFIAPVFASPIVFIPLLAAFQNAEIDIKNITSAKIMIFLVAFQNGFFWKEYFDNVQKEKQRGGHSDKKNRASGQA